MTSTEDAKGDSTSVLSPPSWNSEDKVELPVQDFLEFVQSYKSLDFRSRPKPPTNFFIQNLSLNGKTTTEDSVLFNCEIDVLVLVNAWTKCELLSSAATVHSYQISFSEQKNQSAPAAENTGSPITAVEEEEEYGIQTRSQTKKKAAAKATTSKKPESPSAPTNSSPTVATQPAINTTLVAEGHIGVIGSHHCLIATKKGLYHIALTVSVPYLSKEQKGCSLHLPTYSLKNSLKFQVVNQNVVVQVDPAIETQILSSGEESSSRGKKKQESEGTIISCVFPPTNNLNIHWTPVEVKSKEEKKVTKKEEKVEIRPLTINVEQFTLHSIGGGVLSTASQFNYEITNGSVNMLYLLFSTPKGSKKLRVLRVEGHSIKKWEYKEFKSTAAAQQAEPKTPSAVSSSASASETSFAQLINTTGGNSDDQKYVVRVFLECGVERNYTLKVFAEMEMESASATVVVPNASCLNVNREKGNLAVEGTTSIEIQEMGSVQLTKLDVKELPRDLTARASNPILLGYKFLQSQTKLKLNVIKHEDVAVLVAAIEEALFRITFQEGMMLNQVLLKIRNTTQDFLKMLLPKNASVWSTKVEGKTVRPSQDKEGRILVPLKRSSSESVFTAEIFYLLPASEMKGSGQLNFEFCRFNTIINHAFYEIFVPHNFKYGEFEGDLKEIDYFKQSLTVESLAAQEKNNSNYNNNNNRYRPRQQMAQMQMPMQQMQMQQMQPMAPQQMNFRNASVNNAINLLSNANNDDDDDDMGGAPAVQLSSAVAGVLPVDISALVVGKKFSFEKGVIREKEEALKLKVQYREIKKSWFDKRHLFPWRKLFLSIIFGLLVCLVIYLIKDRVIAKFAHLQLQDDSSLME